MKKTRSFLALLALLSLVVTPALAERDVCDVVIDGCTYHIWEDPENPGQGAAETDCYSPGVFVMNYGTLAFGCDGGV